MRQLATLPDADAAQTFADHLQTLHIETRLEQTPGGCAVWVLDEDRLEHARKELGEFTENPKDLRFAAARKAADAMRRGLPKAEEEYAAGVAPARPAPSAPARPWPWTYGMILTSCLVFAGHTGWLLYQNADLGGQAVAAILFGRLTGLTVLTSPVQQALSIASFHVEQQGDAVKFTWLWLEDVEHGQVWRLVTPIFLHFGLIHLAFNMVMLRQIGTAIEDRRGPWRYLALVVTTALASNVAQYYLGGLSWQDGWLLPEANPAFGGMSGVLYGLFGYIWMKSRYEPGLGLSISPRTVVALIVWLFLCMTGVVGPVANTAHVTGLLVGLVIGVAPHVWRRIRTSRPS
jgi:GlpG protein